MFDPVAIAPGSDTDAMTTHRNYDVIIAGGGPAGSSAAIHLALQGARVLLAEQKKFPRPKLCGEFISPECLAHFQRLGVSDRMLAGSPSQLTETVFYSQNGKHVSVPSDWFSASGVALGLSRAEMDERLLGRAADAGVDVREETSVTSLIVENDRVGGVNLKSPDGEVSARASITIDATGRSRTLARMAEKTGTVRSRAQQRELVAFKAHLRDTRVARGACEIYFYRGGYGGLSSIENGLSNLCFIVNARDLRDCQSNADRVVREIVCRNQRVSHTLSGAVLDSNWLAVSLEGFGRHSPTPVGGLLTIGDAASFIDPFTGSGMLMALESGELVANIIMQHLPQLDELQLRLLSERYGAAYKRQFNSRLRLCSLIRRAAFAPAVADFAIRLFAASDTLRRRVACATRA